MEISSDIPHLFQVYLSGASDFYVATTCLFGYNIIKIKFTTAFRGKDAAFRSRHIKVDPRYKATTKNIAWK
jgi:hypothetical protein